MTAELTQTVLVVDDTPANLGVVAELLEAHGYRVVIAQDGHEALQRARRVRPDLILLDVMMPGIDGFQTCRELKSAEATSSIPVIFMSALSDSHSKVEGFEAGAVDYVTKPVEATELLMRVRTHLALRCMQLRLEALSISDALTGIANRRRFDEVLRAEWLRALRGGSGIGAVMIDIDYFKRYNDHYGHVRGDRCLRLVAQTLQAVIRQDVDLAARYGGEEFVLVLPGADSSSAAEIGERAREAVLALREPHTASQVGFVTISVGAAALVPTDASGTGGLVEAADNALYCAKQQGRNQVVVAGASPRPLDTVAPASPARLLSHSSPGNQLQWALLDSRQRWRDLATMAVDFSFETDDQGCFSFINPDPALGWPAATLLGRRAEMLLALDGSPNGFNPFRVVTPVRRRRAWLKRADGSTVLLAVTAGPLLDPKGQVIGARGTGIEWLEDDGLRTQAAADLRRCLSLEYILQQCREVEPGAGVMGTAVTALMHAVGAQGAALIDVQPDIGASQLVFRIHDPPGDVIDTAAALIPRDRGAEEALTPRKERVLIARCASCANGHHLGLALWRAPGASDWGYEDRQLVSAGAGIVRMALRQSPGGRIR